ncbi:ECF transporter S component (folate family) [Clostridiales Family XIII bacterium PM5-7]
MERSSNTTKLITVAFFIAAEVILTRYLSINTGILRIGFGFLPVAMLGILYGPFWSAAAYVIGDVLGMLIFPSGPYFPGFTLTAALTGLVFGLVLYKKNITWKRSLVASAIVVLGLNLCLDTYWLHILMGQGYLALLPARLIKCAFSIPVQTILIPLVWNKVMKRIPTIKNASV